MFINIGFFIKCRMTLDKNKIFNKNELRIFVKETYSIIEKIYSDFNTILQHVRISIQNSDMTVDAIVLYINESRLPLKSSLVCN